MGWDAFGLPAENAAIREGGHPREITERNIEHDPRADEAPRLGDRLGPRGLVARARASTAGRSGCSCSSSSTGSRYRKEAPVNWCPNDQTVIANEYVVDGHCERCGAEVELRNMTQWFFKTTAYADELLEYDLPPGGDWPERTKTIQRNWIGRSEGAEILFRVEELDVDIPVFTTRPDTLFGATFFVVAPEHPFVEALTRARRRRRTRAHAGARRAEERAAETEKTGVFTGHYATNPVNGERLPIWVADYVLMDYGTGAIMAVPAHDERDREFAETFDLPIVDGDRRGRAARQLRRSSTGCPPRRRSARSSPRSRSEGRGEPTVNYRLRDWSFSRQRYWGCPIPIIHCERLRRRPGARGRAAGAAARHRGLPAEGQAAARRQRGVDERRLPAAAAAPARREADTMDTFVDSSWYFLRYVDPHNDARAVRPRRRRLLAAGRRSTSAASTTRPATCSTRASSSRR